MNVRLDPALAKALEEAARREERLPADHARFLLRRALRAEQDKPGKPEEREGVRAC